MRSITRSAMVAIAIISSLAATPSFAVLGQPRYAGDCRGAVDTSPAAPGPVTIIQLPCPDMLLQEPIDK